MIRFDLHACMFFMLVSLKTPYLQNLLLLKNEFSFIISLANRSQMKSSKKGDPSRASLILKFF